MFRAIRDFMSRHQRKFIFTGIAVGGVAVLAKLAEHKLVSWQDKQTRTVIEQQRRKQHYERTLDTTRITLMQMMPNVRKVLERELDSEMLIQAIKDQPQRKRELWEQLKMAGFGRAVCTIVCTAVTATVSHVMMMVLAANTLDNASDGDVEGDHKRRIVSLEVQTRYLSCLQELIEEQMPHLVTKIMEITNNTLASLPLTRKLTLPQLESILQQVTLSVTNNRDNSEFIGGDQRSLSSVLPWSQYLKEPESIMSQSESNEQLRNLYLVTVDVLNTDDFNEVINTLVQVGLNYVLDEMAGFYYSSHFDSQDAASNELKSKTVEPPSVKEKSDETEENSGNGKVSEDVCVGFENILPSEDIKPGTVEECSSRNEADHDELNVESSVPHGLTTNTTAESSDLVPRSNVSSPCTTDSRGIDVMSCVVVKLIPVLSGIVHKALPNSRQVSTHMVAGDNNAPYYSRLVVCSQLEALAYSVYDTMVLS